MSGMLRRLRGALLVVGVLIAAVGGGFLANWLARGSMPALNPLEAGFLKATQVGATATHGNESVIMCTGEVNVGVEAVYILDVVTGELRGGVLNIRSGRFTTGYSYSNVAKDLQADGVKNPKYLMVTGEFQTTQGFGGANGRVGRAVVYIAETNSGNVAAYAVPWTSGRLAAANPVKATMQLLDVFQFRQAQIVRPQ